jgi:ATP adenylyltransferase
MEYILQPKSGGCFLCEAFRGAGDRETLLLKRGAVCAVIMNRYPYNNGHLMIAPYRHTEHLEELSAEESREMMQLTTLSIRVLKEVMKPEGFNIGMNLGEIAGAGLKDHLHSHVVPRWGGDTNFMPVLADTRVIPQALLELYDRLHPPFHRETGGKTTG